MKKLNWEKFLIEVINKYQPILGLSGYKILYAKTTEYSHLAMEFNYPYASTTLLYNKSVKEKYETGKMLEGEMKRQIIHELCHILTDPLYAKATSRYCSKQEVEDERELLTDKIANIIYQNI